MEVLKVKIRTATAPDKKEKLKAIRNGLTTKVAHTLEGESPDFTGITKGLKYLKNLKAIRDSLKAPSERLKEALTAAVELVNSDDSAADSVKAANKF